MDYLFSSYSTKKPESDKGGNNQSFEGLTINGPHQIQAGAESISIGGVKIDLNTVKLIAYAQRNTRGKETEDLHKEFSLWMPHLIILLGQGPRYVEKFCKLHEESGLLPPLSSKKKLEKFLEWTPGKQYMEGNRKKIAIVRQLQEFYNQLGVETDEMETDWRPGREVRKRR